MFFPCCIYSFMQIEEKLILQDINTNIQFVKHFRHQDRLSGEDEYYLTTLESIVEFIYGLSEKDVKMPVEEYKNQISKALEEMEKEKVIKDEAAKQELTDLLGMGESTQ